MRTRPSPTGKPFLIYDGECGFCRHWVARWRRLTEGSFDDAPYQKVAGWFPDISPERFAETVHLVEPDGRVTTGAEAVFRSLASRPLLRGLLAAYRLLPGFAGASEALYRRIAARRAGFSRLTRWLWGPEADPDSYFLTRWVFLRALAVVYLIAFSSLWVQVDGLIGPDGILPAGTYLQMAHQQMGARAYQVVPTLAWLHPGGAAPSILCAGGVALSVLLLAGIAPLWILPLLWAVYLSLVSIGQIFLSFQWDALLLETGFLAIFLSPGGLRPGLGLAAPPPPASLWMLRWLLFRLMFMSGMVKLLSGDPTWRDLTALTHHFETQPLPTPLAWFAHQLPVPLDRASCLAVLAVECAVPFLMAFPRRVRLIPVAGFAVLHLTIAASGNYGFFNLLGLVLLVPLLDDAFLHGWLPRRVSWPLPAARARAGPLRRRLTAGIFLLVLALSLALMAGRFLGYRRLPPSALALVRAIAPWQTINNYGLFAVMTTRRPEIIVQGSRDGRSWQPYRFRWKPGDPGRAPRFVAPHMPRLDWQMWFAALGRFRSTPWFSRFQEQLLRGSPAVLGLLGENPFPGSPPRYVRALLFDYHFTRSGEADPAWWRRRLVGAYSPTRSLPAGTAADR
ncbi:MAG: lipase maturation factor family protein [Acidobacteriota bacterium]